MIPIVSRVSSVPFHQSKKSLRLREKGYQPIPNIPYNIDSICISIYNLYWISSFTQCFWLFWFYSFFLGPTLGPWTRWARNGTSCLTRASPHGWLEGRLGPNEVENSMQGLKHSLIDSDFQFFHLLSLSRLINFASSLASHHPRTCCQQPWVPASRWSATRRWAECPSVCRSRWPAVSPFGCTT